MTYLAQLELEEEMVLQILLSMAVHRHLEKASNFRRKSSSDSLKMNALTTSLSFTALSLASGVLSVRKEQKADLTIPEAISYLTRCYSAR